MSAFNLEIPSIFHIQRPQILYYLPVLRTDCHNSHASSANDGLMFALVDSSIASLADDATDFDIVIAIADDVAITTTTTVQHSHIKDPNRIIDRRSKGM